MTAPWVRVEVHLGRSIPTCVLVGLPETLVRERKERVRVTVNLPPADLPKEGGRFDLPIAIGILAAAKKLARGIASRTRILWRVVTRR